MPPNRSFVPKRRRLPKEYNKKPCHICGEMVKYIRDVERHKLTHAPNKEELKVRCPVSNCDYATLQKSNVTVHVRKQHKVQVYHCQPSCTFCTLDWMDLAKHQTNVHDIDHNIAELEKLALASSEKMPEPLPAVPKAIPAADYQKPSRKRAPKNQPPPTTAHDLEVAHADATNATYHHGEYAPNDGSNISSFPGWLPHNQAQLVCDGSLSGYSMGYNTTYFQGQLQTGRESLMGNTLQSTWNPILQATSQTSGYHMGYNSYYTEGPLPFVQHPMGLPPPTWDPVLQNALQSSSQASPVIPYDSSSGALPLYHWNERQMLFPSASADDVNLNALGDIGSCDLRFLDPNFESSIGSDGNGQLSTPLVQDPEFCTF